MSEDEDEGEGEDGAWRFCIASDPGLGVWMIGGRDGWMLRMMSDG